MSQAECVLCTAVERLRDAETYQFPTSGSVVRKIAELPTAVAVLWHDQYYPGYTLVVAKIHATELYHLPESESTQYCKDMLRVATALATACHPRKMNYELLGNGEAHLHWHLIPRYEWDPHPKRPIWEHPHEPKSVAPEEYDETIAAIRRALS